MSEQKENWRVSKTINLGDMLTLIGLATSAMYFVYMGYAYNNEQIHSVAEKVAVQQSRIEQMQTNLERDRADNKSQFGEILTEIRLLRTDIKEKADKN